MLAAAAVVAPLAAGAVLASPPATDVTRLPLGDGHVSASAKRGEVFACGRGPGRVGGADHAGP